MSQTFGTTYSGTIPHQMTAEMVLAEWVGYDHPIACFIIKNLLNKGSAVHLRRSTNGSLKNLGTIFDISLASKPGFYCLKHGKPDVSFPQTEMVTTGILENLEILKLSDTIFSITIP